MTARVVDRRDQSDIANRKRRDAGRFVAYTVTGADVVDRGEYAYRPRRVYITLHRDDTDRLRLRNVALAGPERKPDGTFYRITNRQHWLREYLSPDETPAWVADLIAAEEARP